MTTRVQGGRTATPASPPANNSLQPGELYVEMASPLRLWTGVPTSVTASGVKLIVDATAQAAANSSAVQKAGDVMTGPLTLSGSPTQPNQAANKAYADTKVGTVAGHPGPDVVLTHTDISDWTPTLAPYALLNAPTFVGDARAVTPAPGDNDTSIATTAFVAAAISAQPGTVIAPTIPAFKAGQLWWDATGGSLYVGYDDGNTQAYVPATNITLPANVATKADVGSALNNVGRNLIHNSAFTIWQRGVGPFVPTYGYTADRWAQYFANGSASSSQQALADSDRAAIGDQSAKFAYRCDVTGSATAGSTAQVFHSIEDVRRLAGRTVIVSFTCWASGLTKLGVAIDQNFGGGGSPSAALPGTPQAIAISTTVTRYSLVFTVPSVAGKTLGTDGKDCTTLDFYLSNQPNAAIGVQSGILWLWGVQLEIAQPGQTQPTPLEKRDPVLELQQCQRFFQVGQLTSGGTGTAGVSIITSGLFPVPFRGVPAMVLGTPASNVNTGTVTLGTGSTNHSYALTLNPTANGGSLYFNSFTASADL